MGRQATKPKGRGNGSSRGRGGARDDEPRAVDGRDAPPTPDGPAPTTTSDSSAKRETAGLYTLAFPLAPAGDGYTARHINVQLTTRQATAIKRLARGLDERGERLAAPVSRRVVNAADAVRWLLEAIAEAADGPV